MRPVRKFVLRSHQWPCFRSAYEAIYRGGKSLLSILGRLDSSIIGMFLRTSDEPSVLGLSDYDITVTPQDAPTSERLQFLAQFWQRYVAMKRILPMLGEADILPPQDLIDYMLLGPGPMAAGKRLSVLFERFPAKWQKPFQEAFAQDGRHVSQFDLLREALLRHIRFVVPLGLEYALNSNPIQGVRLDHVTLKILSIIRSVSQPAGETFSTLHQEFRELSLACQRQEIPAKGNAEIVPATSPSSEVLQLLWPHLQPLLRSRAYPSPSIVLWTGLGSRDKLCLAVVVEDVLGKRPFLTLIRDLARAWQASSKVWQQFFCNDPFQAYFPTPAYPVFVSRSIWRSWMYLLPFEAAAITAGGQLVAGDASVFAEASPHLEALPRCLSTHYAAMLSLRHNWRTLTPDNRPRFYPLACDQVRAWRSALDGEPIRTRPDFDPAEQVGLHQGYEALQQELAQLRQQFLSPCIRGVRRDL